MTLPRHSVYAGMFLLVGTFVTLGLMFLMTAKGPFSGWGDGAGGDNDRVRSEGLVLPYSSYFLCGFVAACSVQRRIRIMATIVAHSAPLISFAFASSKDVPIFIGLELVTFAVFGFAWSRMLKGHPRL